MIPEKKTPLTAVEEIAVEIRSTAIDEIAAERRRQVEEEDFDAFHDDRYLQGELAMAAAAYATTAAGENAPFYTAVRTKGAWLTCGFAEIWRALWPWDLSWWKPSTTRRNLIKAGALIVAEIERIDRAAERRA